MMLKSVLVSRLSRSSSQIFAFCFALHVPLGLTNKLCESLEGVWPDFRGVYNLAAFDFSPPPAFDLLPRFKIYDFLPHIVIIQYS